MKLMKTESARTLTILAAALLLIGSTIMSPSGAFLALLSAVLCALFPAVFGKGTLRIIAAVLVLAALGLSIGRYEAFKREQALYREHAGPQPQTPSRQK